MATEVVWDSWTCRQVTFLIFQDFSSSPLFRPSPFMESKTKRDINEFYGIHEPHTIPSDGNRREITHHAKTRPLLPNSPYGLINMSQEEMNTLGVNSTPETYGNETSRHIHTPQKQPMVNQSTSHFSQNTTRPHTSGAVFGKSFSEPMPSGVPPNIHFIRIQQSSGPLIIPVRQTSLASSPHLLSG